MEFRCINNKDLSGILTLGKFYRGEYAKHLTYVKIYRCDDKQPGYFKDDRFEVVDNDSMSTEPEVKINHYSLFAEP